MFHIDGLRMWETKCMPRFPFHCDSCGKSIIWWVTFDDEIDVRAYAGVDLLETYTGFCCTSRLRRALSALPMLEFLPRHAALHEEFASKDSNVIPDRDMWELHIAELVEGTNERLAYDETRPACPACGKREYVIKTQSGRCIQLKWNLWRPNLGDWCGAAAFWMVDQSLDRSGPIVTQAFVDIVEDFNLGPDAEIHEVKWAEE